MRKSMANLAAAVSVFLAGPAAAFDIQFDWSGLKACNNGAPNTVASPAFTINDVPEGTKFIRFKLVDKNVPSFNHGGGVVEWSGEKVIPAGSFRYKSPCPPGGVHLYEWTATAQSKKNGGALAKAAAARTYPE